MDKNNHNPYDFPLKRHDLCIENDFQRDHLSNTSYAPSELWEVWWVELILVVSLFPVCHRATFQGWVDEKINKSGSYGLRYYILPDKENVLCLLGYMLSTNDQGKKRTEELVCKSICSNRYFIVIYYELSTLLEREYSSRKKQFGREGI